MNETEFTREADAALTAIGQALDRAIEAGDADADWSINEGIVEIECGDGSKVIVNRHAANREIWVAARSGGFHFRRDGARWVDTRSGENLADALERLLRTQASLDVDLSALRSR